MNFGEGDTNFQSIVVKYSSTALNTPEKEVQLEANISIHTHMYILAK